MSIRFENVSKRFGPKVVLDDVSFEVAPGEVLFVLGKSGMGKSVTLKHIVGLMRPERGKVWVDGREVGAEVAASDGTGLAELRRTCGMVFQHPALLDSLTVYENVAFGLRADGVSPARGGGAAGMGKREAEIRAHVIRQLALVGLGPEILERTPPEISYGMQKRVSLARTLAPGPRYLLFDEPTTGLDPVTTTAINELILELSRKLGVTSIVVSHDMGCALKIADRILVLDQGKILALAPVAEIRRSRIPLIRDFLEEALALLPPEPSGPEPSGPEPSGPELSGPEPSGPEPSGPEFSEAGAVAPKVEEEAKSPPEAGKEKAAAAAEQKTLAEKTPPEAMPAPGSLEITPRWLAPGIALLNEVGSLGLFVRSVLRTLLRTQGNGGPILAQMADISLRTLSTVIFAGVFVGAILVLQFDAILAKYDARLLLGGLNTSAVVREVGPLIISFLLAGKIGAYTAAELGTMRVTEQIEAIECLGKNPLRYLVVPRFAGIVLSSVLLLLIGLLVSLGGSMLVASLLGGINPLQFFSSIPRFVGPATLGAGFLKALVYGSIVAAVACHKGFTARGGARGVGRAVTQAAIQTNLAIVLANYVTSQLLAALGILLRGGL